MSSPRAEGLTSHEELYVERIHDLLDLLSIVIVPAIGPLKALISSLEELELDDPKVTRSLGAPLPEVLANALVEAKAADDIHGPCSASSNDAWERAEKIAMDLNVSGYKASMANASDSEMDHLLYKKAAVMTHHDYLAVVDPQSLEDAMQALMKLEHLARMMNIETNRLIYSSQHS